MGEDEVLAALPIDGKPHNTRTVGPAVPDPTVEARMTHAEESDLKKAFERDKWAGEWNSLPTAIDRLLAARAAAPDALRVAVEALAAEFPECWVTRSEVRCTAFIGGTIGNGEFVEAMCCLPCRLRALLDDPALASQTQETP